MKFSEKLKRAMQQLGISQTQVVGMTGKSKGSISMYLNDKTTPSEKVQSDIAVSLGLAPDYFEQEEAAVVVMPKETEGKIKRLLPEEAAVLLGMDKGTVRKGLQQGVFPWGYAIKTSENRWAYFINARRFAEIEGVSV
ncbi:MAG: helix-turn-helix domain-containing protein [Enterocloster sp.]|jgi:transcriptional regulator with XRE-family HTH domain|uniref:helix-turn-helix domain-containing protein n=2 Tax=Bacillota TaxID=1239 RepID=UPI0039963763